MVIVQKHVTLEFYDKQRDENLIKKVNDRELDETPYVHIRREICENNSISRSEFEKRYKLKDSKRRVRFLDKPWESFEELKSDIKRLDCVNSLYYISPMEGCYGPPRFEIKSDFDVERISDEVNDYYGGLMVRDNINKGVSIVISPTEYSHSEDETSFGKSPISK